MKLSLCGKGINKEFPGVKACNNVDFKTYHGRATGLIGVNGAGKSTLMNIIAGEVMLDSGVFTMDEKPGGRDEQRNCLDPSGGSRFPHDIRG